MHNSPVCFLVLLSLLMAQGCGRSHLSSDERRMLIGHEYTHGILKAISSSGQDPVPEALEYYDFVASTNHPGLYTRTYRPGASGIVAALFVTNDGILTGSTYVVGYYVVSVKDRRLFVLSSAKGKTAVGELNVSGGRLNVTNIDEGIRICRDHFLGASSNSITVRHLRNL